MTNFDAQVQTVTAVKYPEEMQLGEKGLARFAASVAVVKVRQALCASTAAFNLRSLPLQK